MDFYYNKQNVSENGAEICNSHPAAAISLKAILFLYPSFVVEDRVFLKPFQCRADWEEYYRPGAQKGPDNLADSKVKWSSKIALKCRVLQIKYHFFFNFSFNLSHFNSLICNFSKQDLIY